MSLPVRDVSRGRYPGSVACSSRLGEPDFTLPRAELHLHLDCAVSYAAVAALRPGTSLAAYRRDYMAPAMCPDLATFLERPARIVELMQDRRGLELVVADVFDQLTRNDVVYAELRFAPLQHLALSLQPDEVVEIVEAATREAIESTGIEARLILCTLRHFTSEQSRQTAELVHHFQGTLVTALDIAGDEAGFSLDAHEDAFRFAERHGLNRTAHAGEALGAASVWETLARLRPTRIGHGVRSVEDPALVEHLRDERVHLEVCPTSNVLLNVSPSYALHPVDQLYRAGVPLSISTDIPGISGVSLTQEWEQLRRTFGWTDEDQLRCMRHAIEAAFVDGPTRERLLARVSGAHPTG
jgi:adenosine deaminase